MTRPVTLFTGKWADLPLEKLAKKAASWGYDGLELACWGDHFGVDKALEDDGYCETKRDLLKKLSLKVFAMQQRLVMTGRKRLGLRQFMKGVAGTTVGAIAFPYFVPSLVRPHLIWRVREKMSSQGHRSRFAHACALCFLWTRALGARQGNKKEDLARNSNK